MCAHTLEHVCIWRPDNFGCHSSSGLSLAWPGMIPVLGGDWLAWQARGPQGSSCNQPQCCAYTCVSRQIRCDICEDPGSGTLVHLLVWQTLYRLSRVPAPFLLSSLSPWDASQILFQAPEAGFREGTASLLCGPRLVLWKHYVITPFCRRSINTS